MCFCLLYHRACVFGRWVRFNAHLLVQSVLFLELQHYNRFVWWRDWSCTRFLQPYQRWNNRKLFDVPSIWYPISVIAERTYMEEICYQRIFGCCRYWGSATDLPFIILPMLIPIYRILDSLILVDIFGCGCVPSAQTNMFNIPFNANNLRLTVFSVLTIGLSIWNIVISKTFNRKIPKFLLQRNNAFWI